MDIGLSPRSNAQKAINEINYGVSELIDMRMDIAHTMEEVDNSIQEEAFEESPNENRRIVEFKDFNIKTMIVDQVTSQNASDSSNNRNISTTN